MVRVPRYPASPVQEIFLPEPVPNVLFDPNNPAPSSPPAPPSPPSHAQCEADKDRYRDTWSMYVRGAAGAEQVRQAYCTMAKCFDRVAVWEAIEKTPQLKNAQSFSMDMDQVEKDQRYKQLQYGRVPSILSKYHL